MEITIGKLIYSSDGNGRLCIKKAKNGSVLIPSASIEDIEILYISDSASGKEIPTMHFIHPSMNVPHICIDPDKNSSAVHMLHDYLMEYGASERLMSKFKAGFAKHSLTEKVAQEKRDKRRTESVKNREKQHLRAGCKEKQEEKYTCTVCGETWYASSMDYLKNIHNAARGATYNINQMKDISRCPKCGSGASTHRTVKYWVDKKGNCVDREE